MNKAQEKEQEEGHSNYAYHCDSAFNLEKQHSQSDLEESFDHLLPKNDSAQKDTLEKSYLPENIQNLKNKNEQQQPIKQNVQAEKQTSFLRRCMNKCKNLIDQEVERNNGKSSFQLICEATALAVTSYSIYWLKDKCEKEQNNVSKQMKNIKERIQFIESNSCKAVASSQEGNEMIVYGRVSNDNEQTFYKKNYLMYSLNLSQPQSNYNQIYQFPVVKDKKIFKNVNVLTDNPTNKLLKNILLAPLIGGTIQLSQDSNNLSPLLAGENVFILGKKLANSQILPQAIFKKFDFSKYESCLNSLESKKLIFGFIGCSLLLLSAYQLFTFLSKQKLEVSYRSDQSQSKLIIKHSDKDDKSEFTKYEFNFK